MNSIPLASLCLICYNQEKFILEALIGAVSQSYRNLEIIISDDCSTDNTQKIISEFVSNYHGNHKLIVNFNKKNMGLASHVNKVLYDISTGDYIILAAGDDISKPERIEKCIETFLENEEIVAIGSYLEEINSESKSDSSKNFIKVDKKIIYNLDYYISDNYRHLYGCTRAFRRKVIDSFPKLNSLCPTEDTTMLLRSFLCGKVVELPDSLVKYRVHSNSISSPQNMKKIDVEEIFKQYENDIVHALNSKIIDESVANQLTLIFKERKKTRQMQDNNTNVEIKNKKWTIKQSLKKIKKLIYGRA